MLEREADRDKKWQSHVLTNLLGGLNTSIPDYEIADEEASSIQNLAIRRGKIATDTGYVKLGALAMASKPKSLFTHQTAAGITTIVQVTNTSFYIWVAAVKEWHYVSDGASSTLSSGEAGGSTLIDVVNTAGFVNGRPVGILLDNGSQHQTTIIGIAPGAPGTLTINVAIPSAAAIGRTVVQGLVLTGNDVDQVVITAVPAFEWTVFTNGVNVPYYYDGSFVKIIPNLPSGGNVVCKTLALFRDSYLILANLIEGGVIRPYKLLWNNAGDVQNWTTGDASNNSLVDSRDPIMALKPLKGDMIIYRAGGSIVRMEYVGLPTTTFNFRALNFGETASAQGVGCASPNSVIALLDTHIILSPRGIYSYSGSTVLSSSAGVQSLSDKIFPGVFSNDGNFDKTKAGLAFVFQLEQFAEIWFCYADTGATFPNRALVLNVQSGAWWVRKFGHEMTCAGSRIVGAGEGLRIIDLVGTISQQLWALGGAGLVAGVARVMLGCATNNRVYDYDLASTLDDTLAIPWFIETKRFRMYDSFIRHDVSMIEYTGSAFTMSRYRDSSAVYEPIKSVPTATKRTISRGYRQFVVEYLKYRLEGTISGTELGSLSARVREESRWTL
jgi:hypothetical protein